VAATKGRIRAISVSKTKGTQKVNVPGAELRADFGIVSDAHAGDWDRHCAPTSELSQTPMQATGTGRSACSKSSAST